MLLSELLDILDEKYVVGFRDLELPGLAYDSRLVEPREAFFCIKGLVTDGHLYAADAVSRGAAVLFIEKDLEQEVGGEVVLVKVPDTRQAMAHCSTRFFGDPSGELKVVGVTGTNGKTTTTYLVEGVCREAGYKTGIIGTVESHIGSVCLLYTSDAADDLLCVDLGG